MNETDITVEHIEAAERLLGIIYTARERAQMAGNLAGQVASAQARRALSLPNAVPMACRFDPRLPTFGMPAPRGRPRPTTNDEGRLRPTAGNGGALPGNDDIAFAFAFVTQLSAWIAAGALSSRRLTDI